jgi:hypothetical protein
MHNLHKSSAGQNLKARGAQGHGEAQLSQCDKKKNMIDLKVMVYQLLCI